MAIAAEELTSPANPLEKVLQRAANKGGRPKGSRDKKARKKPGGSHASGVTGAKPTLVSAARGIAESARGVGNITKVPTETDWKRFLGKVLEYTDIAYVSAITGDDEELGDELQLKSDDCQTVASPFARRIAKTAFNRKYGQAVLSWEQDIDALAILAVHFYETGPLLRERLKHQSLVREQRRTDKQRGHKQQEVTDVIRREATEGATEQPATGGEQGPGGASVLGVAPGLTFGPERPD